MSAYDPDEVLTPNSPNLPQLPEGWRYGPSRPGDTTEWPFVVYASDDHSQASFVVWIDPKNDSLGWKVGIGPADELYITWSAYFPSQREALDVALARVLLGMWED